MNSFTCCSISSLVCKKSFCYSYLYFFIFKSNYFSISFNDSKLTWCSKIYVLLYFWRCRLCFFIYYFVLLHLLFPTKSPTKLIYIYSGEARIFMFFVCAFLIFLSLRTYNQIVDKKSTPKTQYIVNFLLLFTI